LCDNKWIVIISDVILNGFDCICMINNKQYSLISFTTDSNQHGCLHASTRGVSFTSSVCENCSYFWNTVTIGLRMIKCAKKLLLQNN